MKLEITLIIEARFVLLRGCCATSSFFWRESSHRALFEDSWIHENQINFPCNIQLNGINFRIFLQIYNFWFSTWLNRYGTLESICVTEIWPALSGHFSNRKQPSVEETCQSSIKSDIFIWWPFMGGHEKTQRSGSSVFFSNTCSRF